MRKPAEQTHYLGIPAAVLDSVTVRLTYKTACGGPADEGVGDMYPAPCNEARTHWRKVLGSSTLTVTARVLWLFREHARGGYNGVAWWVQCLVDDARTMQAGPVPSMPADCGWDKLEYTHRRDAETFGRQPARVKWSELERWAKAGLLWQLAPDSARELAEGD